MKKILLGMLSLASICSFAVEKPEIAYKIEEKSISIGFDWIENVSGSVNVKININNEEFLSETAVLDNGFSVFNNLKLSKDLRKDEIVSVKTDVDLINEMGESEKQEFMFYISADELQKYGYSKSPVQNEINELPQKENLNNVSSKRISPEDQEIRKEFIEIQRNVSRQLRRYEDNFKHEIISDLNQLKELSNKLSNENCNKLASKHNRDLDKAISKFKEFDLNYLNQYKLNCKN